MTFEVLLKQIVKEAVIEALQETKVKSTEEPKNWTTNDEPVKTPLQAPAPLDEVAESDEDVAVEETEISKVDLGSMKLKELREYAEELGINSKGKRAEVEERIQEFLNSEESEEEDLDEEVEDDVEEVEEESEEDDSEENDSEDDEDDEDDEKYAQVKEYVENASDEEIKDTLKELGLSTKGKREALIEKLYQAVKDGLFEFAEDDEDLEDTEDVEDIEESEEESKDMTSERAEGIEELEEKVRADFESGDLTRKDMTTYLKQVGVAVTKKVDDDDVLEMYISKMALLVDDEGEFHEEGEDPYTINGVPYCCGAKLEVLEDGGYKCNVCGAEYDDEE